MSSTKTRQHEWNGKKYVMEWNAMVVTNGVLDFHEHCLISTDLGCHGDCCYTVRLVSFFIFALFCFFSTTQHYLELIDAQKWEWFVLHGMVWRFCLLHSAAFFFILERCNMGRWMDGWLSRFLTLSSFLSI